jgi:two-component system chemotaxis response regulator CheY
MISARRDCERVVLVVDDDASIREALADLLGEEGYRVETAGNGVEALDKLRRPLQPRPCVILLDLMMPIMNGQQFYSEQQRDPALSNIPIVVISADSNVRQKSSSFGGEYLAKPVRLETVLGVVERHCA